MQINLQVSFVSCSDGGSRSETVSKHTDVECGFPSFHNEGE
jgi:hypothetical protein